MNQANFLIGYEVITMIIVLVTTKEKSLGTDFNQENWMLVIRLICQNFKESKKAVYYALTLKFDVLTSLTSKSGLILKITFPKSRQSTEKKEL